MRFYQKDKGFLNRFPKYMVFCEAFFDYEKTMLKRQKNAKKHENP